MPNEQQMWTALRPHMVALGLDPIRIENTAGIGTPDVNFTGGWAELKTTLHWPKRGGPLRLDHPPTKQQIAWATRRWHCGGFCCVILRVGKEWYVIHGCDVYALWGEGRSPTKQEIEDTAANISVHPQKVAQYLKACK